MSYLTVMLTVLLQVVTRMVLEWCKKPHLSRYQEQWHIACRGVTFKTTSAKTRRLLLSTYSAVVLLVYSPQGNPQPPRENLPNTNTRPYRFHTTFDPNFSQKGCEILLRRGVGPRGRRHGEEAHGLRRRDRVRTKKKEGRPAADACCVRVSRHRE